MTVKNIRLYNLFLLLCLAPALLEANKVELLIAIPVRGAHYSLVKDQILKIQEQVKKAADINGYDLDISVARPDQMHITLDQVVNVDDTKINAYLRCVQVAAKKFEPFDISADVSKSHFELIGWSKNWGVLRFPAPKKGSLHSLNRFIRSCMQDKGLKKGMFEGYKAHISLGKFTKVNGKSVPKKDNLKWVPEIELSLPATSFVIDAVEVLVRERIEGEEKGKVTFKDWPSHVFPLGAKKAVQPKAEVETKVKAAQVEHKKAKRKRVRKQKPSGAAKKDIAVEQKSY